MRSSLCSFALMLAATLALVAGCGTTNHKKKLLEDMNPGCDVTDDLQLVCEEVELK